MNKKKELRPYLVLTKKWAKKNFLAMLRKYKSIVVKPNKGLKATNVYFITKRKKDYAVQLYENKCYFPTAQKAYMYMKQKIKQSSYIIQRRIRTAKVNGRIFDMRVIIQRKSTRSPWTATAYKARVARKDRFVTNASKGGSTLTYHEAMNQSNVSAVDYDELLQQIKEVSVLAAQSLNPYYPNKRLYGIDIAVRKDGSLHIFEINRKPALKGFSATQQETIKTFKQAG